MAGMVAKIGIDDLKAIYETAGVAYEVKTFDNGKPYLVAAPEGFAMYAVPIDCPDPAKAVDCGALSLESGPWERKLSAEQVIAFNSSVYPAKSFMTTDGLPAIAYSYRLSPGVSPQYIRASLRDFVDLMKYFGAFEWVPGTQTAPAATVGSFGAPVVSASATSELPLAGGEPVNH